MRRSDLASRIAAGVMLAVILLAVLCSGGCATVQALEQIDPGFWADVEVLILALIEDVVSVFGWLY